MTDSTAAAAQSTGGDTPTQAPAVPTPATVAAQFQAQAPAPAAPAPVAPQTFSSDYVTSLRGEAANYRTERNTARQELSAAQAELEQARAQAARAAELEQQLAGMQAAAKLDSILSEAGAGPVAKAAIRGDDVLKGLDPAADDFAAKAKTAIEKYLSDHPELRGTQVAPRSTTGTPGGAGEGGAKPATLDAAIDAHYRT